MSPPWLQPSMPTRSCIDPRVVLHRPVAGGEGIVDLAAAVVDELVEPLAVAGGAAVFGRDHDIALGHEFAHDVGVVGREVGVNPAVGENQQRQLSGAVEILRGEEVGVELDRVAGADAVGVFLAPLGRAVDPDLFDHRHIADPLGPEHVIDELGKDIAFVRGSLEPVLEVFDGRFFVFASKTEHHSCREHGSGQKENELLHGFLPGWALYAYLPGPLSAAAFNAKVVWRESASATAIRPTNCYA